MRYTWTLIFFISYLTSFAQWRPQPYYFSYKGIRGDSSVVTPNTSTVASLSTKKGEPGAVLFVQDPLTGGSFIWKSTGTTDGGTVFAASGSGYWHRVYSTAEGLNIAWFGAVGDSATDCTAAIQAAINASPGTGGKINIPLGRFLTTGNITVDRPISFCGVSGPLLTTLAVIPSVWKSTPSTILSSSVSNNAFNVTVEGVQFNNLSIICTASNPTGDGIRFTLGNNTRMHNLGVKGFYNNINFQNGGLWVMDACMLYGPVNTNLLVRFQVAPDGGDQCISNTTFMTGQYPNITHLEYVSGGGMKLINSKFNTGGSPSIGTVKARRCIYLSNSDGPTVDLLINNCSLENFTESAIDLNPQQSFSGVIISNNQINPNPSADTLIKLNGNLFNIMISGNVLENATVGISNKSSSSNISVGINNFVSVSIPFYTNRPNSVPHSVFTNAQFRDTVTSVKGYTVARTYQEEPTRLFQSNGAAILELSAHSSTTARFGVRQRVIDNTGDIAWQMAPVATGGSLTYSTVMQLSNTGNLILGSGAGTSRVDITGANGYNQFRLRTSYTPSATADTNGNTGDVSWDTNYIYIKTGSGWKRAALSTF